jgi:transcriptional regulator with PAS, ATPase and Fis domain
MTKEEFKKKFGIVGKSQEISELIDIVMQVAPTDITVLIYGESGVGKEVFARAIHSYSLRANNQLVSVNCGAIPEGLLESELFGHKKGSFTGAVDHRRGYFEIADGGTLFLDEIAETPLTTQVKLLRAIESKEFMKIGAETVSKVDVRLITATNKNLQHEVDAKRFREDLYFRLKAVTLTVPPLRKRKRDIEELTNYFLEAYAANNSIDKPVVTNEAIEILLEYNWPGNVRELKNTIESAIALSKTGVIDASAFFHLLKIEENKSVNKNLPVFVNRSPEDVDRELFYRALFEIKKDLIEIKDLIVERKKEISSLTSSEIPEEILPLSQLEKESIQKALLYTKGNKREAAKLLKISERTLYRKINEYNI